MKSPETAASVRSVRKTLADGTVKTYTYARAPKSKAKPVPAGDTLGALLTAYQRSPEWQALAPRTKATRLNSYRHLAKTEQVRVPDLRRRDLLLLRDAIASGVGNGAANSFGHAVGALFSWAVDREWIEHSPATRLKSLPLGTYPTWGEEHLQIALAKFREPLRRAITLAIYTGQRRGDLIALSWKDIAGETIRLRQQKTGVELALPIHPALLEELAAWRAAARSDRVLENSAGLPWTDSGISSAVAVEIRRVRLPGHLSLHGLRKLAAVRLAQAGCSAHEIAAWTGHKTLQEVERYTAAASQERLAGAGLRRLTVATETTAGNRRNTK